MDFTRRLLVETMTELMDWIYAEPSIGLTSSELDMSVKCTVKMWDYRVTPHPLYCLRPCCCC